MSDNKAERIEYIENRIRIVDDESCDIDRKENQSNYEAYSKLRKEILILESILEVIKNEEE